jgi:hypothetical protein
MANRKEEKRFRIKADFEFEAYSIDDALKRLSKHFSILAKGGEDQFNVGGEMHIGPIKEGTDARKDV